MNVKDWLIENDPNIAKLHQSLTDPTPKQPFNSGLVDKVKLRLYQGRGNYDNWHLGWWEGKNYRETGGNRSWTPKYNTSEVKMIWDELQTDFTLGDVSKRASRDVAFENGNPSLLWQVVWIENKVIGEYDQVFLKPIEAYVIYNNQKMWHSIARLRGSTLEFNFTKVGIQI